jgi:putative tryptophan/tyrosine transport system substrate-binding protein
MIPGSIIVNRLIGLVRRIGQDVRPKLGHLGVVAILARVCKKDATGIVLRRPQLARAAGARFWSPFLRYGYHFLLRVIAHLVTAFRKGLKEAGFVEGQNVAIEYRSAEDHLDRLPALVADLIGRQAAVIVGNHNAALAAKAATTAVPIVFVTGADPVRDGLVAGLNRPGGNVTGVSFLANEIGAKRLDLLRQLVPNAGTIAMLVSPGTPDTEAESRDVQAAAKAIGQQLIILDATSDRDIEAAFATATQRRAGALLVGTGAFTNSHRKRLIAMAARHAIPAMYSLGEYVTDGGLISYAASIAHAYRQAGIYAGRILKGEKPSDLPVMQSTRLELMINLNTARAFGLPLS